MIADDYRKVPVERIGPRARALLDFAWKLTKTPGAMAAADVDRLRAVGLDDVAIHDAAQAAAYFNYINRVADGLGVDLEPEMPPRDGPQRLHLRIRGRVQGVSYRWFAQQAARELGLCGWVTNRADGTVEAVAEGAPAQLAAFVARCRKGPPLARVDAIDATREPFEGLATFEVRH